MKETKKPESAPVKNSEEWKTFDLEKHVQNDLNACLSFLCLIRDNPAIFGSVVAAIEDTRRMLIQREQDAKELKKFEKAQNG